MDLQTVIKMNNNVDIPALGLGVFRTQGQETIDAVKQAIEVGYRHIDTAQAYNNEIEVGIGVRESGISREEIFITTKVQNDNVRAGKTSQSIEESLTRLGTEYIDLLLIHWPVDGREAAWKVMEKYYKQGTIRAIGVSNFHKHHIEDLMEIAEITPAVDQFEMHPHLSQQALRQTCKDYGIIGESWSPIGGIRGNSKDEPAIETIADSKGKSAVQVILRWHLQHGMVVLPKSSNSSRILENFQIFDFELSDSEMNKIDCLNKNERVGSDPDNFNL